MFRLITLSLAAWRLAYMLVYEDGPYAVLARLRYRAGLRQVVTENQGRQEVTWHATRPMAELFTCVWCLSIWTAVIMAWGRLALIRQALAVSAGAILIHEVITWLRYPAE